MFYMWSKKLQACSIVLSSLNKCIAQVQTSSYRTSTAPTASPCARGESLPVVLSTEEYKTETDWEEGGGRRKRKQGSLISGVLCAFYLPFLSTAVSALDCFPKEGSARATLTACLLHRSCQCTSQSHDVKEQLD